MNTKRTKKFMKRIHFLSRIRLASACYQANGRSGNGRHSERNEYT
jgi:hypothetical protein